ncbi:MAG: class I SAM-dependent methyltransferase [Gemmatimonadota bacterium]
MSTVAPAPSASATLDVVRALFAPLDVRDFAVRLWDGTVWRPPAAGAPRLTLVLTRPETLRRLLRAGSEAALAEAYLNGDVRIEGDIFAVPEFARALLGRKWTVPERTRIAVRLRSLGREHGGAAGGPETVGHPDHPDHPSRRGLRRPILRGQLHSAQRDRAAVTHHYDLSNRFYSLFLDRRMVYSCAVFRDPEEELEAAQLRKLDLICRKLRLRTGDRLLDIGCGWGALLLHAARSYGAECVGVTLSGQQAELARERVREAGLGRRCRVELRDYRTLVGEDAFDHVVSVGMFEHVGRARAHEYFAIVYRLLRPGGTYLHHAITGDTRNGGSGRGLTDRYVFPDHELIPLHETLGYAAGAGLEVRDVEGLREHYALTLRRWVAALEARRAEALAEVGEPTWRAWHLVFAGAAVDFEAGRQGVIQALMVRPWSTGSARLPLGRWDWYA